ncbi:hypothetical protein FPQ18DRAFT_304541 [Pyronema domesticum]|nr:hypothetical protein FPQ18DRAFT_304541 [Pyronema domesticum]
MPNIDSACTDSGYGQSPVGSAEEERSPHGSGPSADWWAMRPTSTATEIEQADDLIRQKARQCFGQILTTLRDNAHKREPSEKLLRLLKLAPRRDPLQGLRKALRSFPFTPQNIEIMRDLALGDLGRPAMTYIVNIIDMLGITPHEVDCVKLCVRAVLFSREEFDAYVIHHSGSNADSGRPWLLPFVVMGRGSEERRAMMNQWTRQIRSQSSLYEYVNSVLCQMNIPGIDDDVKDALYFLSKYAFPDPKHIPDSRLSEELSATLTRKIMNFFSRDQLPNLKIAKQLVRLVASWETRSNIDKHIRKAIVDHLISPISVVDYWGTAKTRHNPWIALGKALMYAIQSLHDDPIRRDVNVLIDILTWHTSSDKGSMSRTAAQEMLIVFFAQLIYTSQLPDHPEHERLMKIEAMCRRHAYFTDVSLKKKMDEMDLSEIIELRLKSKNKYLGILYGKAGPWPQADESVHSGRGVRTRDS